MAEFDERVEGDTCVLRATGEVDMAVADDFLRRGLGCLDGAESVVVDLSAVTFMDSSGLGVLVKLRSEASVREKEIALRDPSPAAERLLQLTGVRNLFSIVSTGA